MADNISSRQRQILKLLLENKAGLSIDEVAQALGISRTAVQQHVTTLERDGYILAGELNKTAGRPVRTFVLTEAGINSFPKQYAWFAELILTDLKRDMGPDAFRRYLHKLGYSLSQSLLPAFAGQSHEQRLEVLLKVMDDLGFQVTAARQDDDQVIDACNCIYHDLAQQHDEICEFDRALMSALLDSEIEQLKCMAKGDALCRFKIGNACKKV